MNAPPDRPYDWSRFEVHDYYDAPAREVFRAWATAGGLCRFFLEEARHASPAGRERAPGEAARPGDRYHWRWRHGPGIEGEFLGVDEDRLVAFTFGGMEVRVRPVPVDGGTRLDLEQTGIETDDAGRVRGHLNCRSCWVFFLTNLKSVLHHGHDLRDRRPERAMSIEVGFPLPEGG